MALTATDELAIETASVRSAVMTALGNWYVPIGTDATAVQDAIDAANAAGGGVVRLLPGATYTLRNVQIKDRVVIEAYGATIQYGGTNGTVAPLESVPAIMYAEGSSDTPLSGIAILGGRWVGNRSGTDYSATGGASEDGLQFNYAYGAVVRDAEFIDIQQDAITLSDSPGSIATGNRFTRVCDAAVELRKGSDYTVSQNTMDTVRNIVSCKPNISRVVVSANKGTTFGKGIFGHGDDWTIIGNIVGVATTDDGQDGAGSPGISLDASGGLYTPANMARSLISGNTVRGRTAAPVLVGSDATSYTISGVVIVGNTLAGGASSVAKADGVTVEGNVFAATGNALDITDATKVAIVGNQISAGGRGIYTSSPRTLISANQIDAGTAAAIYIATAGTNCTVSNNNVAGDTAEAIHVVGAGTSVTGNVGTDGTQGVRVAANDCVVTGNRFTGMTFWGVNISSGATDTIVANNNLKDNGSGAINDLGTTTTAVNNKP